ncbi:MAG: hypothetical protein ABI651_09790 [Verrucomicrobiota bacterium]
MGKNASGIGEWNLRGAYPAGLISDGYATGLVVLALKRAGVSADNAKLQKAIAWLVTEAIRWTGDEFQVGTSLRQIIHLSVARLEHCIISQLWMLCRKTA